MYYPNNRLKSKESGGRLFFTTDFVAFTTSIKRKSNETGNWERKKNAHSRWRHPEHMHTHALAAIFLSILHKLACASAEGSPQGAGDAAPPPGSSIRRQPCHMKERKTEREGKIWQATLALATIELSPTKPIPSRIRLLESTTRFMATELATKKYWEAQKKKKGKIAASFSKY